MEINYNISLRNFNTFQVESIADGFVKVNTIEDLIQLPSTIKDFNKKYFILGGGSNVLFTKNYDGLIIKNELLGKRIIDENNDYVYVEFMSGEVWDEVVEFAVSNGWGGIENLSLIPGTVGAAPIQNIGAYGIELKDVLHQVKYFDLSKEKEFVLNNAQCKFRYRDSIFKHELKENAFIISVILRLNKKPTLNLSYGNVDSELKKNFHPPFSIKNVRETIISIRKRKLPDPEVLGNAGSFFKNSEVDEDFFQSLKNDYPNIPGYKTENKFVKIPSAWLIEKAGLKGIKINNCGTYEKQPLVIVNYGNATGLEILALAELVCHTVHQKFGIKLKPEVNVIM